MEVIGKVILALPEMSGVSKSGNNWHKREYVLETLESFPRKIHLDSFGRKPNRPKTVPQPLLPDRHIPIPVRLPYRVSPLPPDSARLLPLPHTAHPPHPLPEDSPHLPLPKLQTMTCLSDF